MLDDFDLPNWSIAWNEVAVATFMLTVAVVVAYAIYRLVFSLGIRLAHLSDTQADEMIMRRVRRPAKWSMIAVAITMVAQYDRNLSAAWEPLAAFLRPALLGWIAYTLVRTFAAAMEIRLESSTDPVAARSRRTRISLLSRFATFAILFVTIGLMLFGIPGVRDIGTTLLASAGLAALAIGAAAQPALKSLIGGIQMAITEPLRLGDMVVVDGHTGRVEEIRMSFVIVRTWDERAIVVPASQFLEQSFENWSRQSELLTGPVLLHLDPIAKIGPIRAEFERYVAQNPLSDQRKTSVLLTEAYPESIELRLAVSSATIPDLFTLRCEVREHMIDWLRANQPEALIRHRLEVADANKRAGAI